MNITKLMEKKPNIHVLGCLDHNAAQDSKRVVYARVPYNATSVRFYCGNCYRYHIYALDPKLREQVKVHR